MPSVLPLEPAVPAKVVTTPALVTFRIVWLSVSATKTLPAVSTATPLGVSNLAAEPVPSVEPEEPAVPANVPKYNWRIDSVIEISDSETLENLLIDNLIR